MRCNRQPTTLRSRPVNITELWEVALTQQQADQLRQSAAERQATLTWVTRYCIFRLLRSTQPDRLIKHSLDRLGQPQSSLRPSGGQAKYRHIVCFYGDDLKLVRLAALNLGLTVSALIRLALWLYLPRLALKNHNSKYINAREFFWGGIKRWANIPHAAITFDRVPLMHRYLFSMFAPHQWWGIPP